MKALQQMREEMARRKARAQQEALPAEQRRHIPEVPSNPVIGRVLEHTPVKSAKEIRDNAAPSLPQARPMNKAQTEALLKGGTAVLVEPIPEGYSALSRNQLPELQAFIREAWSLQTLSFDFETNADQDEGVDILHDEIVGVSFSCKPGTAIYLPIQHDAYAANWDIQVIIESFRALWESEDVLKIAFNIKFEHQILLRYGVRMPKKNVADPMIMVMQTAQFEEVALKTVIAEVLPYLWDKHGERVLLEMADPAQLEPLYIEDGDENIEVSDPDNPEFDIPLSLLKERRQRKLFWDLYVSKFTEVTRQIVPDGVYKSGKKKGEQKWKKVQRSFNEMPVDKVTVDYGCKDSDWALQVYAKLKPVLEQEGLMAVHDLLDAPFMMVLGELELNGWRVIPERLQKMYDDADRILTTEVYPELEKALFDTLEALDGVYVDVDEDGDIVVPEGRWKMGNKFKGKDVYLEIKSAKKFNWGSVQHLQWLFFVTLEIPWRKLGIAKSPKTGLPSTGADEIDKMIYANPTVPLFRVLLKKREYEKIRDVYAKGLLEKMQEDTHRIHSSMKLVRTWRLSSSKPNLQNIPRLDNDSIGIRKCFEAKPGYTFVSCDYSQIELRVMAWYADDPNMKDAYEKNQDLHSRVAKEVWHLDCAVEEVKKKYKALRYKAKSVNFGICYGSTEFGLHGNLNGEALHKSVMENVPYEEISLDECKTVIDNYKGTFPGIVTYAMEQINFARENGYVETLFQHRRAIPDINHPQDWKRKKAENQCMNTPIQGAASDIIRLAMVNLDAEFTRLAEADPRWSNVKMNMQIHDDVISECPEEMALEVARVVKQVMERDLNDFLRKIGRTDIFWDVPIIGEPAIGRVWANVLDVKFTDHGGKVFLKETKKEALDITLDDLSEADLNAYRKAGIEVWQGEKRVA